MRPFPRAHKVKLAQILRQFHRRIDDTLLVFRIMQFLIAGQREILAERMPLKTIIGEDTPQIRVARKDHAEHVVNLTLQPARHRPQRGDGGHRRILGGRTFHHDPAVFGEAEQHIDHLEPFGTRRIIGAGNLDQLLILMRVTQLAQRVLNTIPADGKNNLTIALMRGHDQITQRSAERFHQPLRGYELRCGMKNSHISPHGQRSMVPVRRILRCNCITPYSSASAVGGQPGM